MVLEWTCATCGCLGFAVTMDRDEEARRVELSHRYTQLGRADVCSDPRLSWRRRDVRRPQVRNPSPGGYRGNRS